MPTSPFYKRIKVDVLKVVRAIPEGKLCSYASIGEHLDVVPRHVAYILAALDPLEKVEYPWHRVVGKGGSLGSTKRAESGETQSELLRAEGIVVVGNCVAGPLESLHMPAALLESGVAKQTRPADVPAARSRKMSSGSK